METIFLDSHRRRGNALIEMTLVGIPIIFTIISILEMARGMWLYETLAFASKEAVRFAIVHGENCDPAVNPQNNCLVTNQDVARVIYDSGGYIDPANVMVTLTDSSTPGTPTALNTLVDTATPVRFPSKSGSSRNSAISISVTCTFNSALAMFWPGAGKVSFTSTNFPGSSQERIQF